MSTNGQSSNPTISNTAVTSVRMVLRDNADRFYLRMMASASISPTDFTLTDTRHLFHMRRKTSTGMRFGMRGWPRTGASVPAGEYAAASVAVPNDNLIIGVANGGASATNTVSFMYAASRALTDYEQACINYALKQVVTAKGLTIGAQSSLSSAIRQSAPGDVIHLEPGAISVASIPVNAANIKAEPGITIKPLIPNTASVPYVDMSGVEGVTFTGLHFPGGVQFGVTKRIVFHRNAVVKSTYPTPSSTGVGIRIITTDGFTMTENIIAGFGEAISIYGQNNTPSGRIKNVLISGNLFDRIYGDGVRGFGNADGNVVVEQNYFRDFINIAAHMDALQFVQDAGENYTATGITVRKNAFDIGATLAPRQAWYGGIDVGMADIQIYDNAAMGATSHNVHCTSVPNGINGGRMENNWRQGVIGGVSPDDTFSTNGTPTPSPVTSVPIYYPSISDPTDPLQRAPFEAAMAERGINYPHAARQVGLDFGFAVRSFY